MIRAGVLLTCTLKYFICWGCTRYTFLKKTAAKKSQENKMIYFCRLQVVLLHGQAFTSKTWEELGTMALLATNGYQALAMDLPGRHIIRNDDNLP